MFADVIAVIACVAKFAEITVAAVFLKWLLLLKFVKSISSSDSISLSFYLLLAPHEFCGHNRVLWSIPR